MRPDPRQTLDPDNKGYVEADKIRTLLTTHGERFTQEEIDDFLHFAVDAESGLLHYEGAPRPAASYDTRAVGAAASSPLTCGAIAARSARRLRCAGGTLVLSSSSSMLMA